MAIDLPNVDIDPFGDDYLKNPFAHFDALRKAGPVFRIPAHNIYGMARHANVVPAMKDFETFCSGRGVGLSDFAVEKPWREPSLLLETDPPVHDQMRNIMKRVMSLSAIRNEEPHWRTKAAALVDGLIARRQIDGISDLAESFPLSIFPDTVGLRNEGRHHLLPYAALTTNAFGPMNSLLKSTAAQAAQAVAWVDESCERANLTADGWGMEIFKAADAGQCTEAEARRLVRSFLSAGIDTTVNGIGNMLHAFATHPEQWQILRENPSLIKKAFDECLRWCAVLQVIFRTTTRDVDIEGVTIPAGSKVLMFMGAANRDPQVWDNSDSFDIRRPTGVHVGFGYGIHQCLGQMVARMESELLLSTLVSRVAEIRPIGPAERRLNNTMHAFAHLPIELVPAG
jgi:cytochrome P450